MSDDADLENASLTAGDALKADDVESPEPGRNNTFDGIDTDHDDLKSGHGDEDLSDQTWAQFTLELIPGYLFGTTGLLITGFVFDIVSVWGVFKSTTELFILVPVLLALKGNLDMTLCSRLSTSSHSGVFQDTEKTWKLVGANMALMQVQAITVAILAAVLSVPMNALTNGWMTFDKFSLLLVSSLTAASSAAAILGFATAMLVVYSARANCNPDNFAMPIVSALGDLGTLVLLAVLASLFQGLQSSASSGWLLPVVDLVMIALIYPFTMAARKDEQCADVLITAWTPLVGGAVLDNLAGLFLQGGVDSYTGIALLNPVMNGVGGNGTSVYCSRMGSALHHNKEENHKRSIGTLLALNVPLQMLLLFVVWIANLGSICFSFGFVVLYIVASLIQYVLLILVAYFFVPFVFKRGHDPDNYATPIITALGDLFGTIVLVLVFQILYGAKNLAVCGSPV
jgi:solute carrier family 41